MTPAPLDALWASLRADPLLWLPATLLAYAAGWALQRRLGGHPLANPVAVAVGLLVPALVAADVDYADYLDGARFVHFLLGPATVALAVPTFTNARVIREAARPIGLALAAGSLTAIASASGLVWLLGGSDASVRSMAAKSVTTPVAMGVSEAIGGLPSLTAAIVIVTGILGAMVAPPLADALGVRDPRARGFALGVAAHGIGTARAFQESELAGTFGGLGLGLNALLTSVLVPLVWSLLAAAG